VQQSPQGANGETNVAPDAPTQSAEELEACFTAAYNLLVGKQTVHWFNRLPRKKGPIAGSMALEASADGDGVWKWTATDPAGGKSFRAFENRISGSTHTERAFDASGAVTEESTSRVVSCNQNDGGYEYVELYTDSDKDNVGGETWELRGVWEVSKGMFRGTSTGLPEGASGEPVWVSSVISLPLAATPTEASSEKPDAR